MIKIDKDILTRYIKLLAEGEISCIIIHTESEILAVTTIKNILTREKLTEKISFAKGLKSWVLMTLKDFKENPESEKKMLHRDALTYELNFTIRETKNIYEEILREETTTLQELISEDLKLARTLSITEYENLKILDEMLHQTIDYIILAEKLPKEKKACYKELKKLKIQTKEKEKLFTKATGWSRSEYYRIQKQDKVKQ